MTHAKPRLTFNVDFSEKKAPRRLPTNGGTVVLDLDHIWKPV